MADREFTRDSIKEWIKRQLGAPLLNVELSDDQLEDCIDDALDEIAPWVVQRQFVTLPSSECIDVSEYDMAYVINVHKASTRSSTTFTQPDVFNPYSFNVVSNNRALVYDRLEQILYDKSNQSIKDNISFRLIDSKLYLDVGYPSSVNVTIEYSPKVKDLSTIKDRLYQRFVRRFSLAYSRVLLATIRGKYSVSNTPVTLDSDFQSSQADKELELIRQELKDTVNTHFMID